MSITGTPHARERSAKFPDRKPSLLVARGRARSRTMNLPKRIAAAAVLVGVLDLCLAGAIYVVWLERATPVQIPQSIAAGVLGREAFRGGVGSALLGTGMHFLIAALWTGAYAVAYRQWSTLQAFTRTTGSRILVGALYGVLVWAAMAFLVVPLSQARPQPLSVISLVMALGHMGVVGQPIAWLVRVPSEAVVATRSHGASRPDAY